MAWDKGLPIVGRKARYIDDDIRDNNAALEATIDNEHDFTTGGTQTGRHVQGSARCFFQDAAPSTRIDGTAFTSADYGSMWIDSNSDPDNKFSILTNHDPVTWTPVSTEIIATLVAAIHTWAAVQTFSEIPVFTKGLAANNAYLQVRNAAGNGNVDLIKADSGDKAVLGVVTTLPDTSNLVTSAAPTEDVQIANKKYVDDQDIDVIGAGVSKSKDTNYTAATSGILVVQATITSVYNEAEFVTVLSDDNATPTTVVAKAGGFCTHTYAPYWLYYHTISVPIIKGKNYRVEDTGSGAVIDSIMFYPNQ